MSKPDRIHDHFLSAKSTEVLMQFSRSAGPAAMSRLHHSCFETHFQLSADSLDFARLSEALVLSRFFSKCFSRVVMFPVQPNAEDAPPIESTMVDSSLPSFSQPCVSQFTEVEGERLTYSEERKVILVNVERKDLSGLFYNPSLGYVYDPYQAVSLLSNFLEKGAVFPAWVRHVKHRKQDSRLPAFTIEPRLHKKTYDLVRQAQEQLQIISGYGIIAGAELICFKHSNISFNLDTTWAGLFRTGLAVRFKAAARPGSPCYDVVELMQEEWRRAIPAKFTKNGPAFRVELKPHHTHDLNLYYNPYFGLIANPSTVHRPKSRNHDSNTFEAWIMENVSGTAATRFKIVCEEDLPEDTHELCNYEHRCFLKNWPMSIEGEHSCTDCKNRSCESASILQEVNSSKMLEGVASNDMLLYLTVLESIADAKHGE
ncbi:hypothetical protein QR680_012672 [Steinernema hermaphroditum]|uniref:Uncharacterized protein n=1 Tax=Steinernema hermaphroditum TaxID=289476 RepID=A0AA39I2S3_9BILA|nr:hypothetical protein QR680_012672 [Steinernema hermaphroditum]